ALLADLALVRRVLEGREIALMSRLAELADVDDSIDPERINAAATARPARAGAASARRARAATSSPELRRALDAGSLSGDFLDAWQTAIGLLPEHRRAELASLEASLVAVAIAERWTIDRFRDRLRHESRRIEDDGGQGRLDRQRRGAGVRAWTDRQSGMWCLSGRFDPETALSLQQRVADELERVFHGERPASCPADPLLAQDWLRARALANLINGLGGAVGDPEMIIVIDQRTYERGEPHPLASTAGSRVPLDVIRAIAGRKRFVPVVIDRHGTVIRQGAPVGRTDPCSTPWHTRWRSTTGAPGDRLTPPAPCDAGDVPAVPVPGCERHVSLTEAHHVQYWELGGPTDLANLLPLCRHHHDRAHAERWQIEVHLDRSLRSGVEVG
ncbi:MAG: HNH endonuclease signature motif containing protein, partial [Ilumatobacteraceae bacterium]